MNKELKLSIITVNLNNAEGLRRTIDSVINQTYTHFEHIIIDGGSTDGSVEVIKEYEILYKEKQRHLYWVSEPDKGIYNGMNKGIKMAKGEYCQFLNSGDWLVKESILQSIFNLKLNEDILYCDIKTSDGNNWIYPDNLSFLYFVKSCIGHPASFIKKNLFDKYGLYNETFKITADYDFFLKSIILHKASAKHINIFSTCFDTTGISGTQVNIKQEERAKSLKSNFPIIYTDIKLYLEDLEELKYYRSSKLVQLVRKLQNHPYYKQIRRVN